MIQIIIIFAVMQLGFNLLFKPKYNQMSCGLFGVAAGDVNDINIDKLKILGIYNDSRGGHSCGLTIDGDIILGTYKTKLFKDLISECDIEKPYVLPVILGHTRFATGGAHNEENAHPFGFGNNGDYFNFIGTHNGKLHNETELAELFNISTKEASKNNYNVTTYRHKIDSEILLESIYKNGNFKVLESYNGAAALALYNTRKPNTIYLYHGASKKTVANDEQIEERPLFYYQESENVVYYSSLESSLEAIKTTNGVIEEFDHNVVYEIKNGNVAKAKRHIIDRSKCSQINATCNYNNHSKIDYSKKEWDQVSRKWVDKVDVKTETKVITLPATNTSSNFGAHFRETKKLMTSFHKDKFYYENLRFYVNDDLLKGIYVLTKDENLTYVCTYDEYFDTAYSVLQKSNKNLYDKPIKMYFIDGIWINTSLDYTQLLKTYATFDISQISHCSVYPIKNLNYDDSTAFFRGETATLSFIPILGKDKIQLNNGLCKEISKKPTDFEYQKVYFVEEHLTLLSELKEKNEPLVLETKESDNDDNVMLDLYKENITATIEYCIEDCDVSLSNNFVQNQLKSKFEIIKNFVIKTLTI